MRSLHILANSFKWCRYIIVMSRIRDDIIEHNRVEINNIFLYSFTSKYRKVIVNIIFAFSILKEGNCFSYQINWHIICAGAIFIPKPFAKNLLIWHDVLSNFSAINCVITNLYLFMTILPPSRILRWNGNLRKHNYNWEIHCFFWDPHTQI